MFVTAAFKDPTTLPHQNRCFIAQIVLLLITTEILYESPDTPSDARIPCPVVRAEQLPTNSAFLISM